MANLSHDRIDQLRGMLEQRGAALRQDILRETGAQDNYNDIASELADPGDQSFADLSVDLGNAAVARDVTELRSIEAARQRMELGTYGDCVDCGMEIPYARLQAQPMADRCAPCQEAYEKTHVDAMRGGTM